MSNLSFVAQAADWVPELLYSIISLAFQHRGFSFVRILQRCPEFLPNHFEDCVQDPDRLRILTHENGIQMTPALSNVYRNQEVHDPGNIVKAREIAATSAQIPIGILYRNKDVPCYEDLRKPAQLYTPEMVKSGLEEELDRFTIWPAD